MDIEEGAIEIARLRFWLSIVIDLDKPEALPNFDYKFMQGNSLLESYQFDVESENDNAVKKKKSVSIDLSKICEKKDEYDHDKGVAISFEEGDKEREDLMELLREYYGETDHETKKELRGKIEKQVRALLNAKFFQTHGNAINNMPLICDKFFLWHLWFKDVFDKGGFDIVIGNPPYISAKEAKKHIDPHVRQKYKELYTSASGTYDMYIIFIELGLKLLVPNGTLIFITPSKYLSAEYAIALRSLILENYSLNKITDFSNVRVFETAGVSTMVSQISNDKQSQKTKVEFRIYKTITELLSSHLYKRDFLSIFPNHIWGPLLSDSINLFSKIYNESDLAENYADVNACSTASEADIFESSLTESKAAHSFKYINNGTINRYVNLWGYKPIKERNLLHPYLSESYLSQRRIGMFSKPKLIFVKLSKRPQVFLDAYGKYASANTNMLYNLKKYDYKFLLGYFNSCLFNFVYHTMFGGLSMLGTIQVQAPQIKKSIVPKIQDGQQQQEIITIVDKILTIKNANLTTDTTNYERQIDALFYELYRITDYEELLEIEKDATSALKMMILMHIHQHPTDTEVQVIAAIQNAIASLNNPNIAVSHADIKDAIVALVNEKMILQNNLPTPTLSWKE